MGELGINPGLVNIKHALYRQNITNVQVHFPSRFRSMLW